MENTKTAIIRFVRGGTLAAPTPNARQEPRDSNYRTRPTPNVRVSTSSKKVPRIQYTDIVGLIHEPGIVRDVRCRDGQ